MIHLLSRLPTPPLLRPKKRPSTGGSLALCCAAVAAALEIEALLQDLRGLRVGGWRQPVAIGTLVAMGTLTQGDAHHSEMRGERGEKRGEEREERRTG